MLRDDIYKYIPDPMHVAYIEWLWSPPIGPLQDRRDLKIWVGPFYVIKKKKPAPSNHHPNLSSTSQ